MVFLAEPAGAGATGDDFWNAVHGARFDWTQVFSGTVDALDFAQLEVGVPYTMRIELPFGVPDGLAAAVAGAFLAGDPSLSIGDARTVGNAIEVDVTRIWAYTAVGLGAILRSALGLIRAAVARVTIWVRANPAAAARVATGTGLAAVGAADVASGGRISQPVRSGLDDLGDALESIPDRIARMVRDAVPIPDLPGGAFILGGLGLAALVILRR